ncbi:aspartyl protease family protein [Candidatus Fermentibacteria bacterium]|nr:aspartyl protease family protein [Candidatus Fermentibacteria bacterium]
MDSRYVGALVLLLSCSPARSITVDEILGRYEIALGGRGVLDGIHSLQMFGSVEGMGLSGTTYSVQKSPDWVMERIDIGPLSYAWAYAEEQGWIQDHSGVVRTLSEAELEEFLLLAQVGAAAPMSDELRAKMRLCDEFSDSSHVCVVVEHGGGPVHLFFNRDTGLLDKVKLSKLGMPVEARFLDFRPAEGLMLPFRGVQTIAGMFSLEMKVDQVKVNATVSDAVFRRPGRLEIVRETSCVVPISMNGHLIAPVNLGETTTLRFYVDSGAGMSCIDKSAASRLGMTSQGALPAQGVVGFETVGVAQAEELSVGCVHMQGVRLAVVDLSLMNQSEPEPVHGILGYGLFSERSVGRIGRGDSLLLAPPGLDPGEDYVKLPLQFVASVPMVDAYVEGRKGRFIIDTGNSFPLIMHTPFAIQEGIMPPPESLALQSAAGIGGGGDVFVGEVDSLVLGGVRLEGVRTLFSPTGRGVTAATEVAGNIGLPLLERFDWVLDYQNAVLYLRSRQ